MAHSVVLAAVLLVAAGYVARIPVAALAGILIATSAHMIRLREIVHTLRSDGVDAVVLATTFAVTVLVDLITAVAVGVVLTVVLTRVRVARVPPPVDGDETLGD